MITVSSPVNERSTCRFLISLLDESGAPVVPETLLWTLTDGAGLVINGRERVVASGLGEVLDAKGQPATAILLSGEDLQIAPLGGATKLLTRDGAARRLIIEATYNSSVGVGLPVTEEVCFRVANLTYLGAAES